MVVGEPHKILTDAFVGHVPRAFLATTLESPTDYFESDRLLHPRTMVCLGVWCTCRFCDQARVRMRHGGVRGMRTRDGLTKRVDLLCVYSRWLVGLAGPVQLQQRDRIQ